MLSERCYLYLKNSFPVEKMVLLFCLTIFNLTVWGQDGMLIKNLHTGKAHFFKKNSRITFLRSGEMDYSTARLNACLDSSLILGDDTVPLRSLAGIRKKSALYSMARITGIPFMIGGSILMGDAAAAMLAGNNFDNRTGMLLLGAGMFALGYAPYLFEQPEILLTSRNEWSIEIIKNNLGH